MCTINWKNKCEEYVNEKYLSQRYKMGYSIKKTLQVRWIHWVGCGNVIIFWHMQTNVHCKKFSTSHIHFNVLKCMLVISKKNCKEAITYQISWKYIAAKEINR